MSDTGVLPCPRCKELPVIARDDDGLWDATHCRNWFSCGTPMALNYATKREAIEAWNAMMIRRAREWNL